jgi:lysyl-tRNA synthetase class 2
MSLNPLSPETLQRRHELKKITRHFFEQQGFVETDTPTLVQWPSCEPHLDPYEVQLEHGNKGYLTSSPEFGLKKMLKTGLPRVYELAHSYRGHELGDWHSREFLMLEWYVKDFHLQNMIEHCSLFLAQLFPDLPQHQFTVEEWMTRHGVPDLQPETLKNHCAQKGVIDADSLDPDEAFFRLFLPTESALEPLGIVFLKHYPSSQCSYACVQNGFAQRFEVYVHGIEVGNAFEEEKNPNVLKQLLKHEQDERQGMNKPPLGSDLDFVHALENISESISGIAMGWDRLFAIWNQGKNLRDSSPFLPMQTVKTSEMSS